MNSERSIAELARAVGAWLKEEKVVVRQETLREVEECLRYFRKQEGYKRWKPAKKEKKA